MCYDLTVSEHPSFFVGTSQVTVHNCVIQDPADPYNENEYYHVLINEAEIRETESIIDLLNIPATHKQYKNIWIGMDLGYTISPSAILVYGETKMPKKEKTSLKLLSRILLSKVSPEDQVTAIMHLMDLYRPLAFALDATGAGFPLIDNLRNRVKKDPNLAYMLDRIKDCNFSSKVIVGFDENVEVNRNDPNGYEAAAIRRPFIEASTDAIRVLIDEQRMVLPPDLELIGELQAAPQHNGTKATMDQYGRTGGRKSGMHNLDAMRLACFAYETQFIDKMIAEHKKIWRPPAMIIS